MAGRRLAFVPPQLATLVDRVPTGPGWIFEVKYDGYRLISIVEGGTVRLLTRRGNDWTERFPHVADRLARIPVKNAVLDGELVALDAKGRSVFGRLQQDIDAGTDQELTLFLFDILHLDGRDLRSLPLRDRRSILARLMRKARIGNRSVVRMGEEVPQGSGDLLAAACRLGLEGIIGKRLDAPSSSGRHGDWIKVKCGHRQEFVVVGFTPPGGSRVGLGSLLLAVHDGRTLRYAGRVGSGFSDELLRTLFGKLMRHARARPTLPAPPSDLPRGVQWVAPKMVVEVSFTEWTTDGRLRHPVLQGVREDKPATEVHREEPIMPKPRVGTRRSAASEDPEIAGVAITHAERVVYPGSKITKLDLARHFERVGRLMLPHVAGRPLALVRCPEGIAKECFFQKHWVGKRPDSIDTVSIRQSDGARHSHVVIHDVAGLVTLAQWGVMEIHPWGSRADNPDQPDRIIFDLDPGPGVHWSRIIEAALGLRELLKALGLQSWGKTSGGKGLHVVVPIARRSTWEEAATFARLVAEHMQAEFPDRFISKASKAARKGVIFVDWLRNSRGATAVAPWSTRAREGAGVSVPLPWKEIARLSSGDQFTLQTLAAAPLPRTDPWKEMRSIRQGLSASLLQRLER